MGFTTILRPRSTAFSARSTNAQVCSSRICAWAHRCRRCSRTAPASLTTGIAASLTSVARLRCSCAASSRPSSLSGGRRSRPRTGGLLSQARPFRRQVSHLQLFAQANDPSLPRTWQRAVEAASLLVRSSRGPLSPRFLMGWTAPTASVVPE